MEAVTGGPECGDFQGRLSEEIQKIPSQLVVEPTHLEKYAKVKLRIIISPKFRGKNIKHLKQSPRWGLFLLVSKSQDKSEKMF